MNKTDRRETVEVFRERLTKVIERSGISRSAFAARSGLDRSTLSQLLAQQNDRLPRAETIAAIATREHVSVDWLLGLTQEEQPSADILAESLSIERGAGSPRDERLATWHAEAAGYKIRYVPTTLPDLLKLEDVVRYEYSEYGNTVPEARIEEAETRLAYSRKPETDMEVCTSFQVLQDFARGHGIWSRLDRNLRLRQLDRIIELLDELYPTFRWFLYDGLQRYSVPLTIFGPMRAAIYVGNMYLVFTATEHIRVLTRLFDDLIRSAVIQPPDVLRFTENLRSQLVEGQA